MLNSENVDMNCSNMKQQLFYKEPNINTCHTDSFYWILPLCDENHNFSQIHKFYRASVHDPVRGFLPQESPRRWLPDDVKTSGDSWHWQHRQRQGYSVTEETEYGGQYGITTGRREK